MLKIGYTSRNNLDYARVTNNPVVKVLGMVTQQRLISHSHRLLGVKAILLSSCLLSVSLAFRGSAQASRPFQ